jgi:hypothetical protein
MRITRIYVDVGEAKRVAHKDEEILRLEYQSRSHSLLKAANGIEFNCAV